MAIQALIFGIDDLYFKLKPFYEQAVRNGVLEITGYVLIENNNLNFRPAQANGKPEAQIVIVSSKNNFYNQMKQLEKLGFPRKVIIDGRIFQIQNLDFNRYLIEGVCYGILSDASSFGENIMALCPRVYQFANSKTTIKFGKNSYVDSRGLIVGGGEITIGNFSSLAQKITFELGMNNSHNYHNVSTFEPYWLNWQAPKDFFVEFGKGKIEIGNDVWIGHGAILKCSNSEKPLVIGDGAVIASDSVVVKNVPPYAVVGGNPARLIKYRFPEDIIEALLRIKWWNWDIDKIYENFKYFNRVDEFVALHD